MNESQQEIQRQITGVQEQLERKVTEQHKETEKQISGMQTQLPAQIFELLQNETRMLQTALAAAGNKVHEQLLHQGEEIQSSLYRVTGFRPFFNITLAAFGEHKAKGRRGTWESDPFSPTLEVVWTPDPCAAIRVWGPDYPGGYKFRLSIDTIK